MKIIFLPALFFIMFISKSVAAQEIQKNRLIELSDIGAEVDDTQSFVRLLLYSNEIDIKGLIATTSARKKTSVAPGAIRKLIEAFIKVPLIF